MKKVLTLLFVFSISFSLFSFPNREQMKERVGSISRDLEQSVFTNPEENLLELVISLTFMEKSEEGKVRNIHDWICHNIEYDTDLWFSGKKEKQDYVTVLTKKKGVASGFATLFAKMCNLAGVEAIRIRGFSKGFGYFGSLPEEPNHEWNGVKIGEKWHLVDCCWDGGYVDYKTFVKHFSTEWYLLPPDQFIYSHLPLEEKYQFLPKEKIRTKEQFEKEPYVRGKFFNYGFIIEESCPNYITKIEKPIKYTFKLTKDNVAVTSGLQNNKTYSEVNNITWIDRKDDLYTFEYDVPDRNDYTAYIFAKYNSVANYPDRFYINEFENSILPAAIALISENPIPTKSISKNDFEVFKNAFIKVEENDSYYYKEDFFNYKQNNIVTVVFSMLKIESDCLEPVFNFKIQATGDYYGCGSSKKYPDIYSDYTSTTDTHLISPKLGILKRGTKYKFKFCSTNYTNFAILWGNDLIPFKINNESGYFEKEYVVPDNSSDLIIFATKNNINYSAILHYDVGL